MRDQVYSYDGVELEGCMRRSLSPQIYEEGSDSVTSSPISSIMPATSIPGI
jgi:hypothetical protein